MVDYSHLNAIEDRRHHEEMRLAAAKKTLEGATSKRVRAKAENEIAFRTHELRMVQQEIESERKFLGLCPEAELPPVTDADLLELLGV